MQPKLKALKQSIIKLQNEARLYNTLIIKASLSTANELNFYFENLYAIKLTPGNLKCELLKRDLPSDSRFCASIITNQSLFICGNKHIDYASFAILDNTTEIEHKPLYNYSNRFSSDTNTLLSGFSNKTDFISFVLPAGHRILFYYTSRDKIDSKISHKNILYHSLKSKANNIRVKDNAIEHYRKTLEAAFTSEHKNQQSDNDHYIQLKYKAHAVGEALSDCFLENNINDVISLKLANRHQLCKELVIWGYLNTAQEQTLDNVVQALHTTRASLSQGCKEALGIGPMEVLRNIRLEKVHLALREESIRQQLECIKIEDI